MNAGNKAPPMDLVGYYSARAREYDEIYARPERQHDLEQLRELLRRVLAGREIMEIACGTGYWTEVLAPVAGSIIAADVNNSVLEIARGRDLRGKVQFVRGDAYGLPFGEQKFTGGLVAFWWSHVPKARLQEFVRGFFRPLHAEAAFAFIDNHYVDGSSTPICRRDSAGNTYQLRKLRDGSETEVLKNFPTQSELREQLDPFSTELRVEQFQYYWCATGRCRAVT